MNPDPVESVRMEARRWIARRDAGLTAADEMEFRAWLAKDPSHAVALSFADTGGSELDWPWHAGAADDVLTGLDRRAQRRRKLRVAVSGAAAMAAAAALAFVVWRGPGSDTATGAAQPASSLAVVEPRRQSLPDGSSVDLREGAKVSVNFARTERRVTLEEGAAYFDVAPDPQRPFIVSVSGHTVRAVGTAFSVEIQDGRLDVLVTEGRVALGEVVIDAGQTATVELGTSPTVDARSHDALPVAQPVSEAEMDGRLGWRVPRLEFSGAPLQEIITRFNQHNRVQFVLAEDSLSHVKVSGVLRADRVEALIDLLGTEFSIRAERTGSQILLRRSR